MKAKSCAVPAAGIVSKAAKPLLIDEKGTPKAISPIYIMYCEEIFLFKYNHSNIDINAYIIIH